MKKFILTLLGILFLSAFSAFATGGTDVIDLTTVGSPSQFTDGTISDMTSGASYIFRCGGSSGNIQMNTKAGFASSVTGGTVKSVTIEWGSDCASGKAVTVYGSNKAYTAYTTNNNETEIGTITCGTSTVCTFSTDYAYVRIAGNATAIYIKTITVEWDGQGSDEQPTITLAFAETEGSVNVDETLTLPEINATASEGTLPALSYTYTSDKPEVATVENGIVTGVAAGKATITATCVAEGYKVKDATYTVTVVDPNAIFVELTPQTFNYITNSYKAVTYDDETFGVSYSAVYLGSKNYMQFNTKNDKGKGSGINVTAISDNYIISSIAIEFNSAGSGLNVYAKDEAFTALTTTDTPSTTGATKLNSTAITTDQTIEINNKAFALLPASTGSIQVKKVTVNYKKIDTSKTTPTLSFAETEVVEDFAEGKTLAVQVPTSDTEGLSYTYTSSEPTVATVEGTTITLVGPGTTTITVTSAETETLNTATASYTLVSKLAYNNIATILKYATNNEEIEVNFPMTVGHVSSDNKNFFVTDGTDYLLIYNSNSSVEFSYADLDVIPAGWNATFKVYGGLPELVPASAPAAATEKGTYTFETIDAANWTAQPLNKIVIVDNVEFTTATPGEDATTAERNFTGKVGDTELKFFNNFKIASVSADTYKVTAVVSYFSYSQTTIATEANQLAPIAYSAQPTEAVITPAPENDEIKVKAGDEITFTFANASKLEVEIEIDTEDATESESAPVLKAADEPITVEGNTYKYTVPDQVLTTLITVTPYNAEGEKLADRAVCVMLVKADTTGVIDVTIAGEGEVEYFNLQGVRIANPESGLYIRRQGKQVSKVYLR